LEWSITNIIDGGVLLLLVIVARGMHTLKSGAIETTFSGTKIVLPLKFSGQFWRLKLQILSAEDSVSNTKIRNIVDSIK
jgi:hypothetical protein